jgi:hypothetical protein
VGKMLPQ